MLIICFQKYWRGLYFLSIEIQVQQQQQIPQKNFIAFVKKKSTETWLFMTVPATNISGFIMDVWVL